MVSWSWLVSWSWVVSRGFVNWLVGIITWGSFVCYFDNVSRITISSVVFYNLSSAIWKNNSVFTIGRVSITSFILPKVNTSIFVSNGIFVLVLSRLIIRWFVVSRLVSWGRFVYWGWLVSGLVIYWGWSVSWSWVVYWGRLVGLVGWGMSYSMAIAIRVTMFHGGVAGDIGVSNGYKSNKSDEGLQQKQKIVHQNQESD